MGFQLGQVMFRSLPEPQSTTIDSNPSQIRSSIEFVFFDFCFTGENLTVC